MHRFKKFIGEAVLLGLLGLYGCSTPAPLSETIIFPPHETQVDSTLHYRGDEAASLAFNFYGGMAYRYAKANYVPLILKNDKNAKIHYGNFNKIGLGFSNTYTFSTNWAFGYAIGYAMLGYDFTARIKGSYYFTVQYAGLENGQVIIQRPIFHSRNGGITLGAYYRFDNYSIYKDPTYSIDLLLWPKDFHSFRIQSFGLRSLLQSNGTLFPFYGFIAGGYSPEYKKVLFYLGFSLPMKKIK